jgi:ribosome maturation factor RimP
MSKTPTLSADTITQVECQVLDVAQALVGETHVVLAVNFEKESGYWYLRVYVESKSPEAVSLETCERLSRQLDEPLESIKALKDFPYALEVSSPGLFRRLTTERECQFYQGHPVQVLPLDSANVTPLKKGPKSKASTGWIGTVQGFCTDLDSNSPAVRIKDANAQPQIVPLAKFSVTLHHHLTALEAIAAEEAETL